MASSKRERELARMRAERQTARRAAAASDRRRRRTTVLSTLAAVAVVAVVAVALLLTKGHGNKTPVAAGSPTPVASAVGTASATPAAGTCTYTPEGTAAKPVKGTPAATGLKKVVNAVLKTNRGEIDLKLDGTKAPCAVGSFSFLAAQHYFDGTSCHRLTTSGIFVLQCGDPTATGSGGPGYVFGDENLKGATYPRGTVALANGGPGTNGSQFFLVYKDTKLDPNYTPIGTITAGLPVIEQVAAGGSEPANDGKPKTSITIQSFTVKAF